MTQQDDANEAAVTVQRLALRTGDGLALRAERAGVESPASDQLAIVICHPHPLHGGTMFNPVVGTLFDAAQRTGVEALRFNFRGTNGSEGQYEGGQGERLDALAAVEAVSTWTEPTQSEEQTGGPQRRIVMAGYSFGADIALQVDHPAIVGWVAVAPPLMLLDDNSKPPAGDDDRPTLVLAGTDDQFRTASAASSILADWASTTVSAIEGADHFLAEHLSSVRDATLHFVDDL